MREINNMRHSGLTPSGRGFFAFDRSRQGLKIG